MLVTTAANLIKLLLGFLKDPGNNATLLVADIIIMAVTVYLLLAGSGAAGPLRPRSRTQSAQTCRHLSPQGDWQ